jgi:hypothetical protein
MMWTANRKAQGAAGGTVDFEVAVLRAMYRLAGKRKKIPPDAGPGEFAQKRDAAGT